MGDVQTQLDYPKGLTFEDFWAGLKETERFLDKTIKAHEKQWAENEKKWEENDRQRKADEKKWEEYDRQRKEYNKRFGDIDNRFGELVECMISPGLLDKFSDLGLDFETASTNFKVRDHKNKIYFEIDVLLQNGDTAMLVEIKTNLAIKYINEHIARLEKMRTFADLRSDKRTFLGAAAGAVVPAEVKQYALENGLYFIEPSGESLNITPPFNQPKKW
ncbi:MAG: hypothetical protein LBG95_03890 [Treponema sp.]|nr:hypothetical protein [Treponema sp.]